jgi:transcriptional regulator with XRE-family HTH domain
MPPEIMLSTGLRLDALGERIRHERRKRGLSLEKLSQQAEVSRSMLSAVERGEKVPSVLVLDQIATALGSSIARLLAEERADRLILIRRNEQDVVRDAAGWERRILSPVLPGLEFEFMRTIIGPNVNAGVFLPHNPGSREYVAVEKGTLKLTVDGEPHLLKKGDSIYYAGDCNHEFENPHPKENCEYYLAMDVSGHPEHLRHRAAPQRLAKAPNR